MVMLVKRTRRSPGRQVSGGPGSVAAVSLTRSGQPLPVRPQQDKKIVTLERAEEKILFPQLVFVIRGRSRI